MYELVIESISPTTGYYHGGTLVTVTGRNFSPNDAENLVFVGNELNWFCVMESFTETEIQCRMPPYHPDWSSSTQGIIVTSKLIQDSECPGNNCDFVYMDESSSPSLSAISQTTTFSGTGTITLTGTSLDLVPASDVSVVLENKITKEKTVVTPDSLDATTITFTMPSVSAAPYSVRARLNPNG